MPAVVFIVHWLAAVLPAVVFAVYPDGQLVHDDAPPVEYVAPVHDVKPWALDDLSNVPPEHAYPAGHDEHDVAFAGKYWPAAQVYEVLVLAVHLA